MPDTKTELASYLSDALGGAILSSIVAFDELTILVDKARLLEVLKFLRDDPRSQFSCMMDVCGVDYPGRLNRFDVVYHLLSPTQNERIRVKVETDEDTPVDSCVELFPAANWYEREAYDLYGILFDKHPDLRRILTDYGFVGRSEERRVGKEC